MQQRFLNIAMKVSAFMRGRNGPDTLSLFLLAAALLVNAANSFVRGLEVSVALYILAAALFGLAVFRTLSKNIDKRREETAVSPSTRGGCAKAACSALCAKAEKPSVCVCGLPAPTAFAGALTAGNSCG